MITFLMNILQIWRVQENGRQKSKPPSQILQELPMCPPKIETKILFFVKISLSYVLIIVFMCDILCLSKHETKQSLRNPVATSLILLI